MYRYRIFAEAELLTKHPCRSQNANGWEHSVHPEGQPYYVLQCESHRFFTEANLDEDGVLDEVTSFLDGIKAHMANWPNIPDNVEIVLEIQDGWTYYMVDLDKRCVFWLDKHDFSGALGEEFGFETRSQFRMKVCLIRQ